MEKKNEIKYFIPIKADKYFNTAIGYYVISATVEEETDPKYKGYEIFDTLHVIEPLEIKEKWSAFCREFFVEVHDVTPGEITLDEFKELYSKYYETGRAGKRK